MELAPGVIRVSSLSPGYMMTDMMRGLQVKQPELVKLFEKETLFEIDIQKSLKITCCSCGARLGGDAGQDMLMDRGASSWKDLAAFEEKASRRRK